jgi:hypothetical protein
MPGGRLVISSFDPTKKMDWFNADINGFFYTTVAIIAAFLGLFVIGSALVTNLTPQGLMMTVVGISALIAFVIVFCFRKNITVTGEPRQFRYLFRWL